MLALVLAAALQADVQIHISAVLQPDPSGLQRFVEWRQTPTREDLEKAYPAGQHGRLGAALKCLVKQTGELESCDVWTTYPTDPAVKIAAISLIKDFQLAPKFAKSASDTNAEVEFDIIFTPRGDENAPFMGDICPPPFCIPVLPPVPPPPSARE